MLIYLIIILAVASRFVHHIPNFAPITAIAIFSAAYLPWKKSVALTLVIRFISDIFLGFFSWPLMLAVYASHLVGILFGLWIKKSNHTVIPSGARNPLYDVYRKDNIKGSLDSALRAPLEMTGNRWFKIIASSLGAAIIFFLATNFAFLYAEYPHTWAGIISAYTNGLPFFKGTLAGDIFYTAALFGSYEFARRYQKRKLTASNLTI